MRQIAALAGVVLLSGCAFNIGSYGSSVDTVESIRRQNLPPVSLAPFTATKPGVTTIYCRGTGPVETADKKSFESYIEAAMRDDLKLAGIYDPDSKLVLNGNLDAIDFSSNMGVARWMITLSVSSTKPGYATSIQHQFSTNFVGDKACQQVAGAFVPAIQQLVRQVAENPQFKTLFTN
jgi:hypothetical protein